MQINEIGKFDGMIHEFGKAEWQHDAMHEVESDWPSGWKVWNFLLPRPGFPG